MFFVYDCFYINCYLFDTYRGFSNVQKYFLKDYKDYKYNQNFEEIDTEISYPTDTLNPLSFTQGLYKD
ncbi:hypothetical protein IO476_001794 [Campylobacter coli]|nr:hypothetical protein [Campylobacter coli]